MNLLLILIIAGAGVGFVFTLNTRSSKLAAFAKQNNLRFDKEKNSVTTALTAGRLEFFTKYFHQYQNVFTFADNLAFIRMADDFIYQDDNPKTKPTCVTIFTAELKKLQFPALKVVPHKSLFSGSQYTAMKTNIPSLDEAYTFHAPTTQSGLLFTKFITGILKTHKQIYLELNDNALIYHEHSQVPVEDISTFRFRAMQVLTEIENILLKMDKPETTENPEKKAPQTEQDEAVLRAEAMLKALCSRDPVETKKTSGFRGSWIFILMAILIGMSLLSWFLLNNALPR